MKNPEHMKLKLLISQGKLVRFLDCLTRGMFDKRSCLIL